MPVIRQSFFNSLHADGNLGQIYRLKFAPMIEPSSSPSSKKMKALKGQIFTAVTALVIDFTKEEGETLVDHEWRELPNYEALVIIWLFELRDFPSKFVLGDAET